MVSGSSPARTATAWPTFGVRTANVRILSQIKKLARNLLETFPQGEMLVEAYRRDQRVRKARRYLEFGSIYPADREAILQDFRAVCINTQLTPAGICNLESVAREIIARSVEGAFVECGTWRGGSLGFWARTFVRNGGHPARCPIFGFDSFQGMPQMTKEDGESTAHWLHGKSMSNLSPAQLSGALEPAGINLATEQDVWSMVEGSGFPRERVTITKGWFQDTLPLKKEAIGNIAVLRLDGDFYDSTKICLETLYDQVVWGGIVIIDDYGVFPGCRRAVDEFIAARRLPVRLVYVDVAVHFFFKP
jgi:O-methyltransferase